MLQASELFVFGEGSAALLKAYLVDRKFRLAVDRVQNRITALQCMREGAAPRRVWEVVRVAEIARVLDAEEAAAAGASFMGKIWYRMRVRKEQRQKEKRNADVPKEASCD